MKCAPVSFFVPAFVWESHTTGGEREGIKKEALANAVGSLWIPPELFERVTASIRDAVFQAFCSPGDSQDGPGILLQVYVSLEAESQWRSNQNWGFFWIKKTGEGPGEHRTEVYLYPDG